MAGAAGSYTTETLLSSVRMRAMLKPSDDGTSFPRDSDLITLANQEVVSFLVPWIMEARQGHFIQSTDIPLAAGQSAYPIPSRATAEDISLVQLVDSNGVPIYWPGIQHQDMEIAVQFPQMSITYGQPAQYWFQANNIMVSPTPSGQAMSLRVYFPQRPNQLVASASVGVVTSFSTNAGTVTCSGGLPATFTGSSLVYECVHAQPGFEAVALGVGSVSGNVVSFTAPLPSGVNVRDSLCLQDTANFLTFVPPDMLGLFAQWLAVRIVEFQGKADQLERLENGFKAMARTVKDFLGKRDALGHHKVSVASSRFYTRRPMFWVK